MRLACLVRAEYIRTFVTVSVCVRERARLLPHTGMCVRCNVYTGFDLDDYMDGTIACLCERARAHTFHKLHLWERFQRWHLIDSENFVWFALDITVELI